MFPWANHRPRLTGSLPAFTRSRKETERGYAQSEEVSTVPPTLCSISIAAFEENGWDNHACRFRCD
jgi:hypothetical protein